MKHSTGKEHSFMFHVKHIENVNIAYYSLIIDIIEIMSYNRLDIEKGGQEKEKQRNQLTQVTIKHYI